MTEKDLQTSFNKYLRARWTEGTAAFELKICKTKKMPFSAVRDHQVKNLQIAKNGLFPYKIADVGLEPKPFDCFVLSQVPSYIGVLYYKLRGEKKVYLIDVDDFANEKETSMMASISEERAGEMCKSVVTLL